MGPGAVSRVTAGALASGTIPDGTCRARVNAIGGGGASGPTASGLGGVGGAGASITATFAVLPLQTYQGNVGGGGGTPTGGTGNGAVGTGGTGGTVVTDHRGGGGGGRSTVDLAGSTILIAGGGGGGGGAHQAPTAGNGGGGGIAGIGAGVVAVGSNGVTGSDSGITATGGTGGQAAAGGVGGTNSSNAALNGAAGTGIGTGTGGNGGPDPNYDSGGGGGGGYTGGGGGAATVNQSVTGAGGGGGSSWVSATSPVVAVTAPTAISGVAGTASPIVAGVGATGSVAIDWLPCLYALSISKTVSSSTVNAGGSVVWTVAVTNTGPDPMTRGDTVDLADTLPVGPNGSPAPAFKVLSMGTSGGSNANMASGAVTCTGVVVGSTMPASTVCSRPYSAPGAPQAPSGGTRGLNVGETLTITYEQIIANTAPCATITNTATTTDRATQTGTTDITGVAATRTSSASLTIACYDLAITKVASPKPQTWPTGTVTWTITVTNLGPGAMEGPAATNANPLIITDTFPSTGVAAPVLVSSVGPAGACTRSGSTITCPSSLPAAGVQVLTFTQAVNAGAPNGTVISNTATVTDPKTGDTNDSSTDSTTVGIPAMTVTKSGSVPGGTANVAGETITYTITVANTGNLTLTGVSVSDPLLANADCDGVAGAPFTTTGLAIAVGASLVCSGSHAVTQAELDTNGGGDGDIDNTATAGSTQTAPVSASAAILISQTPAMTVTKSGSVPGGTANVAGETITYTITVANTGNLTLTGVSVSDPLLANADCDGVAGAPFTTTGLSIAVGASLVCSGSHAVTQAELDTNGGGDGDIDNTATAGSTQTAPVSASAAILISQTPAMTVTKSGSVPGGTANVAGETITYTITVANTGNLTLTGVSVSDPLLANADCDGVAGAPFTTTGLAIAVGASLVCSGTHAVTQAELDTNGGGDGDIDNTATAGSTQTAPVSASAAILISQTPAMTVTKSGSVPGGTANVAGETITYTITVANTGNLTLTGVSVSDPLLANADCDGVAGAPFTTTGLAIAVGASLVCSGTHAVTQAELDTNGGGDGDIDNTATAGSTQTAPVSASAAILISQTPAMTVTKSGSVPGGTANVAGETITYTITVANTGNLTLTGVSVSDPLLANADCDGVAGAPFTTTGLSIAVGASLVCSGSHAVTQAELDTNGGGDGDIDNTATAGSTQTAPVSASAAILISQTPAMTVTKSGSVPGGTANVAGETITYTITVANTGNLTLTGVSVSDPLLANADCDGVAGAPFTTTGLAIAVGASLVCSGTHAVTQAELDTNGGGDGDIDNTATAGSTQTAPVSASAAILISQTPAITLDKQADIAAYATVGDVITYTYTITNTGNVTLIGGASVSRRQGDRDLPAGRPRPGPSVDCTRHVHHRPGRPRRRLGDQPRDRDLRRRDLQRGQRHRRRRPEPEPARSTRTTVDDRLRHGR